MSSRPRVSVIVPFAGTEAELSVLITQLQALIRMPQDELIVADNRRGAAEHSTTAAVAIVSAPQIRTPAFARNAGARRAHGEWLVFVDADTLPTPSLLADYFVAAPDDTTAVLAGAIADTAARPTLPARYAVARAQLDQRTTLQRPDWPYAQSANCAVRRIAFEQVGGFHAGARAGEDADLCFRLQKAGWGVEERPHAVVAHRSRETLVSLLGQLARHGSGSAWCNRRHAGSFPAQAKRAFARRIARSGSNAVKALASQQRETAGFEALDLLGACAFELGRLLPNERG